MAIPKIDDSGAAPKLGSGLPNAIHIRKPKTGRKQSSRSQSSLNPAEPKINRSMFLKNALTFTVILLAVLLSSCVLPQSGNGSRITEPTKNSNQMTISEAQTDADRLGKIISLPYQPQNAVWKLEKMGTASDEIPGPNDYEIDAVLEFSKADADKIQAAAGKQSKQAEDGIFWQDWFPASLSAQARTGKTGKILDGVSLSPEMFIKSPYLNGVVIRINGTNTFFVSLHTT